MFRYSVKRQGLWIIPLVTAALLICACSNKKKAETISSEEDTADQSDSVNLSQTKNLFDQPVLPNPLTQDPNKVLVRVNGEPILLGEVNKLLDSAMRQLADQIPPEQQAAVRARLFNNVKEQLIAKKLVDAAVAESGLTVTDNDINETLEKIRKSLKDTQTLEELLKNHGMTLEDYTASIKHQLILQKFFLEKTKDISEATEEEAQKAYENNKSSFVKQVTASHILIKVDPEASEEVKKEKKAKLEKIREDIINNKITFAEAAKKYSEDPDSAENGGTYTFGPHKMVPAVERAAFTQELNTVGQIIQSKFGYHIIMTTSREYIPFAEVKDAIQKRITEIKKQQAFANYVKSLRDAATIELQ